MTSHSFPSSQPVTQTERARGIPLRVPLRTPNSGVRNTPDSKTLTLEVNNSADNTSVKVALPSDPSSATDVFSVEDVELKPLRQSLLSASAAGILAGALFLISTYAISSFTLAFWISVFAALILLGVGVTIAKAASRTKDDFERFSLIITAVAVALLSAAALADQLTIGSGVLFAAVFAGEGSQLFSTLMRTNSALLALCVSALAFVAWRRALLPASATHEIVRLPTKAQKIERGIAKQVLIRDVKEGNLLLFVAGERLPIDGIIADGNAHVDESAVTGTLTPVLKVVGMHVFAGSTLRSGRILVNVKAIGPETMLAQLQARPSDELEKSLTLAAASAQRAVVVASAILGIALAAAGYFFGGSISALTGLAIALAPGALAATIVGALGTRSVSAAVMNTGARVRTPHALARVAQADTLVIERTGVLTSGSVRVEHVVSFRPYTQQQVLNTAAALELHSEHRHAAAIVSFARGMGAVGFQRVDDVREEVGGVTAQLNGKRVVAGNLTFVHKHGVDTPPEALEHAAEGKTIIIVASDGITMGYIALVEPTRAESKQVIAALQKLGVHVMLLTGEPQAVAKANAAAIGIIDVVADATTAVKLETYVRLRSEGKTVIAVSTVARPEVAVSIVVFAQRSTAVSVAGADIVVRSDDLSTLEHIVTAVRAETLISKQTLRHARIIGVLSAAAIIIPLGSLLFAPIAVGSILRSAK